MKVYLAGPFFNDEELQQNEEAEKILESKGLDVFVPRLHVIEGGEEMEHSLWAKKVYDMDVEAIKECDVMVVLYSGLYSDSGTAFESGYAKALDIPIVTVYLNREISSLMVTNASHANLMGFSELKDYDFGVLEEKPFLHEQK